MVISQNIPMNEQENFKIFDLKYGYKPTSEIKKYDFRDNLRFPVWLSNSLQMTTHENNLIALSSPQVGMNYRAFYIVGFESACFNPIIVDQSESEVYLEETTSTDVGLIIKIKRPEIIRVRWTDALGDTDTYVYSGLTSRVFQRKMDFLDGVDIRSRATRYHLNKAIKNLAGFHKDN